MNPLMPGYLSRPRPHLSGLSSTVPSLEYQAGSEWPSLYAAAFFGEPEVLEKFWIRVAGTWRQAAAFIRVSGVWKSATAFIRVASVWK